MDTAYEVFNYTNGAIATLVRTEREALALATPGSGLDYEAVRVTPCYCDSAYHAAGHKA